MFNLAAGTARRAPTRGIVAAQMIFPHNLFRLVSPAVLAVALSVGAVPSVVRADTAPSVTPVTIQQNATITITDTGFSPTSVAITRGGTVTWINKGNSVHTASSQSAPAVFDTGGLANGQSWSTQLIVPGTYLYHSAIDDDQPGRVNSTFDSTTSYSVSVIQAAAGSTTTAPAIPFSGPTIFITDSAGLSTTTLNIRVGQTVSWLDLGSNAHSIVTAPEAPQQFDSGLLGAGGSFAWAFTQPGTYAYSSPPDIASAPANASMFQGTIVVS